VFRELPTEFRLPIVITQHLPESFVPYFAMQIALLAKRPCDVAVDRMRSRPGRIIIAPGDGHLEAVKLSEGGAAFRLTHEAVASGCMPSLAASQTTIDILNALLEARTGQQIAAYRSWRRRETRGALMPEIVATDVSDAAIARARSGRFSQFEIQRGLPVRRMIRWFYTTGGDWIAKPELLGMIAFRRMNLVSDPPPSGQFDIVLCRNVLLYSSADTKSAVFPKIAKAMRPEGILVMGVGQTVIGQTYVFAPSMRFRGFYEKVVQA
jgi:SAM-dependent methyltransferase